MQDSHSQPSSQPDRATSSRKRDHVELCVEEDVTFKGKTTGLERYELEHNALPELDLAEVSTATSFLGRDISMPIVVSSMTGGYDEAERINRELAEVCQAVRIPMGVGSQRQALESGRHHESFRVARAVAPDIPLFGNVGAAELAAGLSVDEAKRLVDLIEADGFAVHLNPLQELLQPEGTPRFSGVLAGIERLVRELPVPVIVKEVGAGLSADVVTRLAEAGVRIVDVAGAGGTSWSGVEILRRRESAAEVRGAAGAAATARHPVNRADLEDLWDWGIPTAEAIAGARGIADRYDLTLIGSGGIAAPRDVPVAIALGAHLVGCARPLLQVLINAGQDALKERLERWGDYLRAVMFLTGSATIAQLRTARLRPAGR